MPTLEDTRHLSIDEAQAKGIDALVKDAELGHKAIVLRDNQPVAAIVNIAELERERAMWEEQLADLAVLTSRILTAGPDLRSLDEVLEHFGYTREELLEVPDEAEDGIDD